MGLCTLSELRYWKKGFRRCTIESGYVGISGDGMSKLPGIYINYKSEAKKRSMPKLFPTLKPSTTKPQTVTNP